MRFYLALWVDTGVTLSNLGVWERDNPYEYEAYMQAYVQQMEDEAKQRRDLARRQRKPRRIN